MNTELELMRKEHKSKQ